MQEEENPIVGGFGRDGFFLPAPVVGIGMVNMPAKGDIVLVAGLAPPQQERLPEEGHTLFFRPEKDGFLDPVGKIGVPEALLGRDVIQIAGQAKTLAPQAGKVSGQAGPIVVDLGRAPATQAGTVSPHVGAVSFEEAVRAFDHPSALFRMVEGVDDTGERFRLLGLGIFDPVIEVGVPAAFVVGEVVQVSGQVGGFAPHAGIIAGQVGTVFGQIAIDTPHVGAVAPKFGEVSSPQVVVGAFDDPSVIYVVEDGDGSGERFHWVSLIYRQR